MKKQFIFSALAAFTLTLNAQTSGSTAGQEWVDLGLPSGKLWAKYNYGGSEEDKNGAWKSGNETDVIANEWGNGWQTASRADFEELLANCNVYYAATAGGLTFTSNQNYQSITFPAGKSNASSNDKINIINSFFPDNIKNGMWSMYVANALFPPAAASFIPELTHGFYWTSDNSALFYINKSDFNDLVNYPYQLDEAKEYDIIYPNTNILAYLRGVISKADAMGETTSLKKVQSASQNGKIYDLQGKEVNAMQLNTVYIKNGEKIVITK